jgi:hypothetical protein
MTPDKGFRLVMRDFNICGTEGISTVIAQML